MRGISGLLCCVVLACAQSVDDGIAAFHAGRYTAARDILAKHSTSPAGRAFHAMAVASTGSCAAAEPELDAQFQSNPDAAVRRLSGIALTQCQIARKDFNAAQRVLSRLQADFPTDEDVLYQTSKLHMRAWNESIQALYRNAPASYRVNQLSAEVFETQARFGEAIVEYRKAIAKNPVALNLHFRLGRALLLSSHEPAVLAEAQKEFEAELVLNPGDSAAEYEVGTILLARQKRDEAVPHFERAASLTPDFPEALVALGKIRADAKQFAAAIELLERAVKIAPAMESARYSLMMAYRNAGRVDDAKKQAAEIEKLRRPADGEFSDFLKKLGEKP